MPSYRGRIWPASTSKILLVLALTVCLLAMHSLTGPRLASGTMQMGTPTSVTSAISVAPQLSTSLIGNQSGSGTLLVSAMEDCAALITTLWSPLGGPPVLGIALRLLEPVLRGRAPTSDPPPPTLSPAIGVLRI